MNAVYWLEWDADNEEHIARHGVAPEEVEQVCFSRPLVRRGRRGTRLVYGQTLAGRYLLVVLRPRAKHVMRCITARPMTNKERRYYVARRSQ